MYSLSSAVLPGDGFMSGAKGFRYGSLLTRSPGACFALLIGCFDRRFAGHRTGHSLTHRLGKVGHLASELYHSFAGPGDRINALKAGRHKGTTSKPDRRARVARPRSLPGQDGVTNPTPLNGVLGMLQLLLIRALLDTNQLFLRGNPSTASATR